MAGGHGGRRAGAGRKFGSRQLYTVQKSVENATQFLRTNNMRVFEGDSVALMVSVYKNEDLPLNIRLQCAMAVAPFERPRLVATANLHKNVDGNDDAKFAKLFAQINARLGYDAEARAQVIDMLREEAEEGE